MAIAIVIILLVIGSLIFHFVSPWWFTPLASNWQAIDDTINIALWVTGLVFILVGFFLAFVVFKYRHNSDRRADYEPENKKLEGWLTLVTTLGVAAMLAPGLFVWGQFISVPPDSDIVEAVGQQWHWSYRLPGKDGILGKSSVRLVSEENPFGLALDDVNGQDDLLVNSNELHLPINKPIKVMLRSKDVLHNFAVPQFRVKMDLVPGEVTYVWFTPTKLGRFELLCEELCGVAHFTMRGHIMVDSPEDYHAWKGKLPTFAQSLKPKNLNLAQGKALYSACSSCHGEQGQGNAAMNAPRLAGLSKWYLARQLSYYKDKVRGQNSADTYGAQMAAMSALLVNEKAIKDVSAYLNSLPNLASTNTSLISISQSDSAKGKHLFTNCAYCHGQQGQGNYAMNAPKLSGQHPWYLKRQLTHYKNGLRGKHPKDLYGSQMMLMSKTLHNEQDIDRVVQYIHSLPESSSPPDINTK